jgi:hypothetical protein
MKKEFIINNHDSFREIIKEIYNMLQETIDIEAFGGVWFDGDVVKFTVETQYNPEDK